MYVSALTRLGRIDIRMGIYPNHSHLLAQSLGDSTPCASNGANCDRVVTAQCEDQAAVLCMLVDLRGKLLCYGTDGERILHVAKVGV